MKRYLINDKYYELIKNYNDGFDFTEVESKLTDYLMIMIMFLVIGLMVN
ncbi:MAG: hypothetical protein LRY26_00270 [Bacilli bacterium]|nr:hypothetical protein [Bacilli bacterium]